MIKYFCHLLFYKWLSYLKHVVAAGNIVIFWMAIGHKSHYVLKPKKYKPPDLLSDQGPNLSDKVENLQEEENKATPKLNGVWWD